MRLQIGNAASLAAALLIVLAPRASGALEEPVAPDQPLLGFSHQAAREERALEGRLDAQVKRENLREWMRRLSAKPHHVGSVFGKEVADFLAAQFTAWGYETTTEEFEVLFPTPKTRLLEMVAPESFTARLEEVSLPEDATSGLTDDRLPPYHAYSIDGEVTGELVYVNYGVPKDYETLAEKGIDVKGRVVIARYGGSWRGIKPKVAAEHGAIGCLVYSDPRNDGYYQGDVYPKGAWRPESGAQRGSVADMPLYPGDPLTPGVAATKDARRLSIQDAPTLTKIPVLPISYADALPLLRALTQGPVAPEDWRGALPVTYHLGPGPAKVHLKLAFDWKLVPAYDVVAKMAGVERPEQWVIRGNHHDAWVFGADDPLSGTVALMEEARAISELRQSGWKPKRTILFTVWDAEEPGLIGSTEWVEAHAAELKEKAVAYINSDANGRGFLGVGGSHTLEGLVNEVAREVTDPEKRISVAERLRAYRLVKGAVEEKREARERRDLRIGALGSGSDYSAFLDHLGVAALNIGYGGEDEGGSYHSIYDSFDHYCRFGDPNFDYGITLVQTTGRVILRLANAEVLPFEFTNLADTIEKYVKEVKKLADDLREETRERDRLIREKTWDAVFDPMQPYVRPQPKDPVPYLNFAPLDNALARLQESAAACQGAMKELTAGKRALSTDTQEALDAALMKTERAMTSDRGLPRRPWYKHQIYAPGFYTGYGVKTLPGVREAIEERHWPEATEQIEIVARTLEQVAEAIDRAAALAGPKL